MREGQTHRPLVTLTTDFGTRDAYAAAMKGVLLSGCPDIEIVDCTHSIAPQDLMEAALFVAGAMPHFPPGAIHVIVVDPGVGTDRHPIVAVAGGQVFVCPDNGVLSLYLRQWPLEEAYVINDPAFMEPEVSATFHGRDVFAPAAARIAAGAEPRDTGPPLEELVSLPLPEVRVESEGLIHGQVIHADRFGNCITNVHLGDLDPACAYQVQLGGACLPGIMRTYGDCAPGTPLALFGSNGFLEVAVAQGNASALWDVGIGAPVTLFAARH